MSLAERDERGRWLPGCTVEREVPIAPLREAFKRSGLTAAEVARVLDWYDHRSRPDSHRVQRAFGIAPSGMGHGYAPKRIRSTTYERALMLADAIGIDPVDLDL